MRPDRFDRIGAGVSLQRLFCGAIYTHHRTALPPIWIIRIWFRRDVTHFGRLSPYKSTNPCRNVATTALPLADLRAIELTEISHANIRNFQAKVNSFQRKLSTSFSYAYESE
jgi:hypothetical protein